MGARIAVGLVKAGAIALAALAHELPAEPAAAQQRDFLFGKPNVTVGARLGLAAPTAGSEVFDFTTEELTVKRGDFAAIDFEVELGVRLRDRLDLALNIGHSESNTRSEFRNWVGADDLPIEQTTRFALTPVTLGAKAYLKDRGRAVSRFAWVPDRWSPYAAAGGGLIVYKFSQHGEFVDYDTRDVFQATFTSEGAAPTLYGGAGVELSLGRSLLATGEVRYLWSRAGMSRDFVDFDAIDLSSRQLVLGLAVRF